MIRSHHIRCGDCPDLITERWWDGSIAAMCSSKEAPWKHPRILSVTKGNGAPAGELTIRARWCHDITEKKTRGNRK